MKGPGDWFTGDVFVDPNNGCNIVQEYVALSMSVTQTCANPGPDQFYEKVMAIQVFYEGNVQGVGFRYSVLLIARGFDVTGFVRNLRDGRVELQASGDADEVRAFIEAIGQSQLRSHIKKQSETPLANPPPFRGFEIRYD